MIVIAVINRGVLAPRVTEADRHARRALRRNALGEIALGLGIVVVVGRLGVTAPAAHEPTVWPFAHTLSTSPMEQSAWIQLVLAAAGIVAFVAAIFLIAGLLKRPPRVRLGAIAALALPAFLFPALLVAPAHPTTYTSSPVGYTTTAVSTGASLYASSCSACHGRDGRGGGLASPPISGPGDLAERIQRARGGDLYWSIAHGVPNTAMPGFASRLTETEIWSLIAFLDAQSAMRNAAAMTERVKPLPPIPAPNFTYELAGRAQQSLLDPSNDRVTLLVIYTLPASHNRLIDIATNLRSYEAAGARVVAVAIGGTPAGADSSDVSGAKSIVATTGADVAAAYALFAQGAGLSPTALEHVEYLIDRQGDLRVRWIGVPGSERGVESLAQIRILVAEPPRPIPQWGHRH
jgi:mono/diheme cytochrome c family protein